MHQERMPSGLSSLIAGRQQFANRNPAGTLAKLPDAREGFVDLFLTPVDLGHDPGDAAPVTRNNQRCAPLHFVQELRKMNFGFRGLNLTHSFNQSIRPVLLYHGPSPTEKGAATRERRHSRFPIDLVLSDPVHRPERSGHPAFTGMNSVGGRTRLAARIESAIEARGLSGQSHVCAKTPARPEHGTNPDSPGDEPHKGGSPRSLRSSAPSPWRPERSCGQLR